MIYSGQSICILNSNALNSNSVLIEYLNFKITLKIKYMYVIWLEHKK